MATAPILEFENVEDEVLARTPAAREGWARVQAHDAKVEGAILGQRTEQAKIRQGRDEIARMKGTIERDEERVGPMRRQRDGEMVVIDRLTPLREKDAQLANRSRALANEKIPPLIGDSCRDLLKKNRNRALSSAAFLPEIDPAKADHKSYVKQSAVTDGIAAKIKDIWARQRPLADVVSEIPGIVDQLAQAPRLADLFRGFHVAEHSGKRTVEKPGRPEIQFPETRVRQDFGQNFGVVTDAVALECWLRRDLMIEKLTELARARANDATALSVAEKHAALESAYAEFEKSIRLEVAIGFAVEEQTGGTVHFRRAHPAVFLGLAADPEAIANYRS